IDSHGFTGTKDARHVDVRQSRVAGPEERVGRSAAAVHFARRLTQGVDADRRARLESRGTEVQQPAPAGPDKRMIDPAGAMGPTSNLRRRIEATGLTRIEGGQRP